MVKASPTTRHTTCRSLYLVGQKACGRGVNVKKVEALIEAGRMRQPGLKEIEAAKADGRWNSAYESQKNATVPPDFTAALDQTQRAKSFFESLNKTDRYAFIWRITTAKNPEMRRSRIQKFVAMLEEGK